LIILDFETNNTNVYDVIEAVTTKVKLKNGNYMLHKIIKFYKHFLL